MTGANKIIAIKKNLLESTKERNFMASFVLNKIDSKQ